ncbi:hypothetical protein [Aquisphaera giovannonii]|nr:hypothetical protein [Aquisphaera giovannonii]
MPTTLAAILGLGLLAPSAHTFAQGPGPWNPLGPNPYGPRMFGRGFQEGMAIGAGGFVAPHPVTPQEAWGIRQGIRAEQELLIRQNIIARQQQALARQAYEQQARLAAAAHHEQILERQSYLRREIPRMHRRLEEMAPDAHVRRWWLRGEIDRLQAELEGIGDQLAAGR